MSDVGGTCQISVPMRVGDVKRLLLFALVCVATLPLTAAAHEARTLKWVNLRAGPARGFPLIARLPPATRLTVEGCTPQSDWCHVMAPSTQRGWVYAPNISYPQEHAQGGIPQFAVAVPASIRGADEP